MILETKEKRLIVDGRKLPPGDVDVLENLLRMEKATAFELMEAVGKIYVQYVQLRLRTLIMLKVVIKQKRGIYIVNPEIKLQLQETITAIKAN